MDQQFPKEPNNLIKTLARIFILVMAVLAIGIFLKSLVSISYNSGPVSVDPSVFPSPNLAVGTQTPITPTPAPTPISILTPADIVLANKGNSDINISNGFLIVKHDYQMPYGSSPDIFYIFDYPNNYTKPAIAIRTNITANDRGSNLSYQLVGNRIYYLDIKDRVVKWVDLEGGIHPLNFTKMDDLVSSSFLVSSDNEKIVWVDSITHYDKTNQTLKTDSKLMLANIDGTGKKLLLEKKFDGEKYIKLARWSNISNEVYFYMEYGGLGGYIIFSGYGNLSKINIDSGKVENITDKNKFAFDLGYITDISPDEKKLAHFPTIDDKPKFAIRDLITGKDSIVDIPYDEGFKGGGDAHFSPDNKHVVYDIAHWNPDDEYYRTIVVDSDGKNQKIIIDDPEKTYTIERWLSNNKIIVQDMEDYYLVNIDGTGLSKLSLEK